MKKKMFNVFFTVTLENGDKVEDNMRFLADDITDVTRKLNGYYLPLESKAYADSTPESLAVKAGLTVPCMWISAIIEVNLTITTEYKDTNASN